MMLDLLAIAIVFGVAMIPIAGGLALWMYASETERRDQEEARAEMEAAFADHHCQRHHRSLRRGACGWRVKP